MAENKRQDFWNPNLHNDVKPLLPDQMKVTDPSNAGEKFAQPDILPLLDQNGGMPWNEFSLG
jgi:hypothetical protein